MSVPYRALPSCAVLSCAVLIYAIHVRQLIATPVFLAKNPAFADAEVLRTAENLVGAVGAPLFVFIIFTLVRAGS